MMAQLLWLERKKMKGRKCFEKISEILRKFCEEYPKLKEPKDILLLENHVRSLISCYNLEFRLNIRDKISWPRQELDRMCVSAPYPILPPQSPLDYIEESKGWSAFGQFNSKENWVGHGLWWKSLPKDAKKNSLENAAGNAMNDCDCLEDNFCKLKKASVITADYQLLREDFPELYDKTDVQIEKWLLENCAYMSEGQVGRISKGGDHNCLLGLEAKDIDDYIDSEKKTSAMRLRSGGRAAAFLTNKQYKIINGKLVAGILDVKGVGTHKLADTSHPKVTGLLNYADAIRELIFQRLIQRIIELEGKQHCVRTVKFYAMIDTGLSYKGVNPATGWKNEKCVLSVRQRNSRILDSYDGFNFSGVCPLQILKKGAGKELRRLLIKYGVSAEFFPRALLHFTKDSDGVSLPINASGGLIDDLEGVWNLQCDATGSTFMDFTDFYVLPNSPLPKVFRMTESALRDCIYLERKPFVELVLASPKLRERIFEEKTEEGARKKYLSGLAKLSKDPKMIEAAHKVDEKGIIKPNKPKYCMCWFMELDDSDMTNWGMSIAKTHNTRVDILGYIDSVLPTDPIADVDPQLGPDPKSIKLTQQLLLPRPADGESTHIAYHRGWVPGKQQLPPHGIETISKTPAELGRGVYRFLISCVVPRPIALVSTISSKGVCNLAPYSYFGAMGHSPATVCFAPCRNRGGNEKDGYDKDTLKNIKETKQFVVHIMSDWFVDVANHTCGPFLYGEDEFKISGATPIPSKHVKPPRVAESAVQMECELVKLVEIKDDEGIAKSTIVIGNIVCFHVHKGVYDEKTGTVKLESLRPISRMGGNTYAQSAGWFDLPRPDRKV